TVSRCIRKCYDVADAAAGSLLVLIEQFELFNCSFVINQRILVLLVGCEAIRQHLPCFEPEMIVSGLRSEFESVTSQRDALRRRFVAGLARVEIHTANLFPAPIKGLLKIVIWNHVQPSGDAGIVSNDPNSSLIHP